MMVMMIMMTLEIMMEKLRRQCFRSFFFFTVVTSKTDSGTTPLHLAASEGLLDCTEILVQAGADVLARDSMGHTPLVLARIWCHGKVAR